MIRFLIYLVAEQLFNIVAMLLAPILPAFASMQDGRSDNSHCRAVEPRLPRWLSWFMTLDNSLWGDVGWLLDTYIKNPATAIAQPKALFICSPRLRRAING
jgi:hypothetical protein